MAEKRKQNPKFTSMKGTFKWPRLNEPDTKFKPEGEYSVKLIVPQADAKPLLDKLAPLHADAVKEGKAEFKAMDKATLAKMKAKGKDFNVNPFYSDEVDEDGEKTGNVEFFFKMTASGTSKKTGKEWSRKPAMFDARGKKIVVNPWGGTVGKVSFEARPYFIKGTLSAGLKLALEAVQIIDLVEGGQRSASAYGFEEEEGYEGSDAPAADTSDDDDNSTQDAGDGEQKSTTDF